MWQARGKNAKLYIQRIDVPCEWLSIKIYPHVCCCVDIIISLHVVHVRMLIIQRLTICNFHFLLSIDKTKENNQHNKSLNKDKMMLNLYSTISLSNITKAFMVTLHSNIKTYGGTLLELTLKISKFKEKTQKRKRRQNFSQQRIDPRSPRL